MTGFFIPFCLLCADSIPKSDRTSIHKNLFIALICAQVILLCSGSAIHNKVTSHYLLKASVQLMKESFYVKKLI